MTHLLLPSPLPLLIHRSSSKPVPLHARRLGLGHIPNAASNGDPSPNASSDASTDTTPPPSNNSKPAGAMKNRLRARNQSRRVQLDTPPEELEVTRTKKKAPSAAAPRRERQQSQPKKWEEMSLAEKALELYVGEKGLLFWLNKLAYASIFIMVGAWILFRFVGPSIGLYQLDAPPLPPTAVFGS